MKSGKPMIIKSIEENYKFSPYSKILQVTFKDVDNKQVTVELTKRSADMLNEFSEFLKN